MGLRILAIDPSMNRIGWALFEIEPDRDFDSLSNWSYGAWSPPAQGRAKILAQIKAHFSKANADHLVCELPTFFDSEKGRIAAKSGYTIDLGLVIGTIYGIVPSSRLFLYTPTQWKGSVPKRVTQSKFKRVFKVSNIGSMAHDTIDAIMLLRFHVEMHFQLKRN